MVMNTIFRLVVLSAILFQLGCSAGDNDPAPITTNNDVAPTHKATSDLRPNILLIVADDLGYSDIGAYGGEIDTPNLNALANNGVRFTSFYASPNCSPTRAMLMTGQDSHSVGLGAMAEALNTFPALKGNPGYEGYLDTASITVAEKLSAVNYRTMMAGKWHLGATPGLQPNVHGFDRSFALSQGGGDHFGEGQNGGPALMPVTYYEDGQPATYPVGEYSSNFYADRLIEYMTVEEGDDRPFFAYLAFTAPHWPLQAPKDLIAKYEGRYDAGPEALRASRLESMNKLGLLEEGALNVQLESSGGWDAMPAQQQAVSARKMEIYAAMVDSLDQNIGKVLQHLRETGELENTIVIFMSDNGAEGINERHLIGRTSYSTNPAHKASVLAEINTSNIDLDKMGTSSSFLTYGEQWAKAAMAPFRNYKGSMQEGGIKVAAFVSGPGVAGQRIVNSALSVRDFMPTALSLAGVSQDIAEVASTQEDGIQRPSGKSLLPILNGSAEAVRTEVDAMAWELFYKRAVRLGDWKAVYSRNDKGRPSNPDQDWSWKLYDLKSDPSEGADIRAENPDRFEQLMTAWQDYASANGVVSREIGVTKK